jgi:osmotically-inducible protein OsmY
MYDIDVDVNGGVATLTGTVPTEADRAKAATLANVKGIARVDNKILVDLPGATKGTAGTIKEKAKEGAEKTKEGAEKVGEKTKEGAEKVVDKTKEGLSKTGEVITDGWITTRVKSKFVGEDLLKDRHQRRHEGSRRHPEGDGDVSAGGAQQSRPRKSGRAGGPADDPGPEEAVVTC